MVVLRHRKHSEGFRMSRLHTRQCSDSVALLPSWLRQLEKREWGADTRPQTHQSQIGFCTDLEQLTDMRGGQRILLNPGGFKSAFIFTVDQPDWSNNTWRWPPLQMFTYCNDHIIMGRGKSTRLAFANLLFQIHTDISIHLELFSCRPMNVSPVFTQLTGSWRKHLVV